MGRVGYSVNKTLGVDLGGHGSLRRGFRVLEVVRLVRRAEEGPGRVSGLRRRRCCHRGRRATGAVDSDVVRPPLLMEGWTA